MIRCGWEKTELEIKYHDEEWCKECHDDKKIFEFLILEGMQAGLSWRTILDKRENMRQAFSNFDYLIISKYGDEDIERLLQDKGIIRNRRKIDALITNAQCFLDVQKEFGSFSNYIWSFVDGKQLNNNWTELNQVPASSELSDRVSEDLKKRGFKFVGTVICYSFLQAIGVINDHLVGCSFKN